MNKERLSRLITQYQKNLEFYRNAREFNEQDCRDEFISPLLESFGWDVHNEKGTSPQYKEVVVEKFSNSGDRPDYTLTLNGVSKIFVEAKKPAVNIKEESEPAIQARRYGWNAKHKLSILTNFEDMMIYDVTNKPQDGDAATVSLYRKYHYLEYLKKYEEIYELISRESVYTGKYDEYVEEKFPSEDRYSTEVDEVFLKQINEWRLEIGDYLYHMDSTYRDIEFLNDVVQEFINQIIFLRICEDRNLGDLEETIEFQAEMQLMDNDFSNKILSSISQRFAGVFKGKTEANNRITRLLRSTEFSDENSVLDLVNSIILAVDEDIDNSEKKITDKKEFYDYLYGLEYVGVSFKLKMGGRDLEELSPGERGIVLLIFYLALSQNSIPIIIDQPEDNLDNQSVYNKLVPCICAAKQKRQVIIVTHNPNIAVACDAEQIICCKMDKNTHKITYLSGAIEDQEIKQNVVDILEGTMPAFDLRRRKYV